jgi:hypothetical protein
VGVSFSIFGDMVHSLPHFESEWLCSVRDFLCILQGHLHLDLTFVPEVLWVIDSFIMDDRGEFTNKEICKIYYCRLYLQAITVSDISNASDNELMPEVHFGNYTIWSGVTHYHNTQDQSSKTRPFYMAPRVPSNESYH